jgi:hypothetical protein
MRYIDLLEQVHDNWLITYEDDYGEMRSETVAAINKEAATNLFYEEHHGCTIIDIEEI